MQLIVTPAFLDAVDEWRRKQPDLPNRSEAIRRMVEIAAGGSRAAESNKSSNKAEPEK